MTTKGISIVSRAKGVVDNSPGIPTGEAAARRAAADGSERLFNAMAIPIERIARRKNVSFDDACIMAQNCVGEY